MYVVRLRCLDIANKDTTVFVVTEDVESMDYGSVVSETPPPDSTNTLS